MLSDAESDEVSEIHQLTINEHYAKAFQYKKEREELTKLKEKYGSDAEESDITDSDSEEDVTEDEDGEELTPALDAAILRTLARIKKKDPEIYDSKKAIFDEEQQKVTVSAQPSKKVEKDKSKPLTIRQAALASALDTTSRSPSPEPPTYVQEQDALRKEAMQAFHGAVNVDDDDEFLVPREKVKDDAEMEEEEYRDFLEREVGSELKDLVTVEAGQVNIIEEEKADGPKEKNKKGDESQGNNDKKKKKKKKSEANGTQTLKSKEEANQEFLMNYILNRGWIDRSFRRVPTHKDIVGESTSKPTKDSREDNAAEDKPEHIVENSDDLSGDEEFEEVNELFETSYNFRFEEPDGMIIKTHPRNISATVRREDSTRKEARERRKQRKEEELQRRREEVKRLKALKLRELRKKLERIGKEGGRKLDDDPVLQDLDLEADWDPDAHDKHMNELYGTEDGEDAGEEEKPQWDDDIDIGDIVPHETASSSKVEKKKKKKKKKKQAEDDDDPGVDIDVMDADVDNMANDEEWDGTEEMRKRVLSKYIDELHELDFNDIVAGMPTRFKYTGVPAQDFQLTPAEILMADDADLNQYMSIKKYAPYRKSSAWDRNRGERLKEFKQKFKPSILSKAGPSDSEPKKRKGKKERMRLKQMEEDKEVAEKNGSLTGKASTREDKKAADEDIEENGKRKRESVIGDHDQHAQETKKKRKRRKKNADSIVSHT